MTPCPAIVPKPSRTRRYVNNRVSEGRIYITAKVEALPHGFDAYTVTADLKTGAYVKRGRIFMDAVEAQRWLSKQTVSL